MNIKSAFEHWAFQSRVEFGLRFLGSHSQYYISGGKWKQRLGNCLALLFCISLHFLSAVVFFAQTTVILFEIYFCSSLPEQIVFEIYLSKLLVVQKRHSLKTNVLNTALKA